MNYCTDCILYSSHRPLYWEGLYLYLNHGAGGPLHTLLTCSVSRVGVQRRIGKCNGISFFSFFFLFLLPLFFFFFSFGRHLNSFFAFFFRFFKMSSSDKKHDGAADVDAPSPCQALTNAVDTEEENEEILESFVGRHA